MNIKKILFPTDFSQSSISALNYAVDLAKNYGAKLYMMHVIYDIATSSGTYVPHISMTGMYEELEAGARKEMDRFGVDERKDLKDIEYTVIRGIPYEEILKFAGNEKVDMIVIGTHGRKGLDRMLFGSTAERVVRNAACPVLTVRGSE